jgi:hypothetical protein
MGKTPLAIALHSNCHLWRSFSGWLFGAHRICPDLVRRMTSPTRLFRALWQMAGIGRAFTLLGRKKTRIGRTNLATFRSPCPNLRRTHNTDERLSAAGWGVDSAGARCYPFAEETKKVDP